MGLMLCGAGEACRIHNSKVGGSKPPKANAGFSSVGRAFDCSGYKHRIVAGSIPASLNWNFFGEIHPNLVKLDFGPIVQMVITCGFDSHNPSSNLGWTLEQLEEQMGSHVFIAQMVQSIRLLIGRSQVRSLLRTVVEVVQLMEQIVLMVKWYHSCFGSKSLGSDSR